ncbi:MAG: hypothetical protein ACTSQU_17720 [Promethearchaeota archaeon]
MHITRISYKKLSLLLIVVGIILSVVSILSAVSLGITRLEFFNEENIVYEKFSVRMSDGASINSLLKEVLVYFL